MLSIESILREASLHGDDDDDGERVHGLALCGAGSRRSSHSDSNPRFSHGRPYSGSARATLAR